MYCISVNSVVADPSTVHVLIQDPDQDLFFMGSGFSTHPDIDTTQKLQKLTVKNNTRKHDQTKNLYPDSKELWVKIMRINYVLNPTKPCISAYPC
jgi:hypothetical protein